MRKWRSEFLRFKIDGKSIDDWNGAYALPHPKIREYYFQIIVGTGLGWDHVSACLRSRTENHPCAKNTFIQRTPFWEEMCFLKDFFFDKSEVVIQFHPAETEYVNNHDFVLHLWRPQGTEIPTPQKIMV